MANYASNFISGAGTGAMAGALTGNPAIAIGGGVLGALAGLFSAAEQAESEREKKRLLEQAQKQYNLTQDEVQELMESYYSDPQNFLGTQEDVDAYRSAVRNYNPEDFVHDFNEFSYDKGVDDFMNPYADRIIDATADKVQHTAAGAGLGRGTGAANAIADEVAKKNDELYKTALSEYNTDRSRAYSEWSGNIQAMQNRLNQLKMATDTQMNNLGNLAQDFTRQKQDQFSDQINAKQNRANGNLQLASMNLMI